MKKIIARQSGFTLLEMIFAIGFLLMTVGAILGLTFANIAGEAESENQVIANNLARESIEVVRNIRDSNWLAKAAWDNGLICTAPNKCITWFNSVSNVWSVSTPAQTAGSFFIYRTVDGLYFHNTSGEKTIFSRHIFIDGICRLDADNTESVSNACSAGNTKIGLRVRAIVSWQEKGRLRQVSLEDLLYAWK